MKASTIGLAIIIVLVFFGVFQGQVPATWLASVSYDLTDLPTPGNPDRPVYQKWRNQRRTGVANIASGIPAKPPSSAEFYSNNKNSAQGVYEYHLGERKLHADADGTHLPDGPLQVIPGQTSSWIATRAQVFEGDRICAEGTIWSERYFIGGQNAPVGPGGVNEKSIEDHTAYDPRFPMFALLGRLDKDEGKVFVINGPGGCAEVKQSGWLEAMPNQPYINANGLVAPGFANYTHGAFSIVRIEHSTTQKQTDQKEEPKSQSTQGQRPRMSDN